MLNVERTIVEAKKLLNVPFRHYGRTTLGLDCLGFLWLVYTRAGFGEYPRIDFKYDPLWWTSKAHGERLLNAFIDVAGFEITDKPVRGCLVTFRLYVKDPPVNHCGIYLNEDTLIHACSSHKPRKNKVIIDNLRPYIRKKYLAYYLIHKDICYESNEFGTNSR